MRATPPESSTPPVAAAAASCGSSLRSELSMASTSPPLAGAPIVASGWKSASGTQTREAPTRSWYVSAVSGEASMTCTSSPPAAAASATAAASGSSSLSLAISFPSCSSSSLASSESESSPAITRYMRQSSSSAPNVSSFPSSKAALATMRILERRALLRRPLLVRSGAPAPELLPLFFRRERRSSTFAVRTLIFVRRRDR
mmetsp:Transcript_15001/g.62462  ORF Transcript_15001/g.62462 Transcript_15001/m.62462 type:complete len:201 (-) Transcript_15001:1390-1992(-)